MTASEDITVLLHRFQQGDVAAQNQLVNAVHGELRLIAARYMRREKVGHTLQTTALVNEAYLKLINIRAASWQDRAHFFAVAAQIMRRILVDHHVDPQRGFEAKPFHRPSGLARAQLQLISGRAGSLHTLPGGQLRYRRSTFSLPPILVTSDRNAGGGDGRGNAYHLPL